MGEQKIQSSATPTPTPVSGKVSGVRNISRRKWLIVACTLLIIVLGVAVWAYHAAHVLKFPDPNMSSEEKYHYLADQGNYKGAERILNGELAKARTKNDKVAVYFQQAAVALQFKNYKDAQAYANKAVAVNPNSSDAYETLSVVAAAQGDKRAAKNYLQQAIDHLDKNLPQYNLVLQQYKSDMQGLGV